MVWNVRDKNWDKMYKLAREYYAEYGDLKVPSLYITSNGERLGRWIDHKRSEYKEHKLTEKQISMLESIGMVWNLADLQWIGMYKLAKKYSQKHGNLEVPQNYITSTGEKLGLWIGSQRKAYENRNIPKKECLYYHINN